MNLFIYMTIIEYRSYKGLTHADIKATICFFFYFIEYRSYKGLTPINIIYI